LASPCNRIRISACPTETTDSRTDNIHLAKLETRAELVKADVLGSFEH
jgi:hypothetical protein